MDIPFDALLSIVRFISRRDLATYAAINSEMYAAVVRWTREIQQMSDAMEKLAVERFVKTLGCSTTIPKEVMAEIVGDPSSARPVTMIGIGDNRTLVESAVRELEAARVALNRFLGTWIVSVVDKEKFREYKMFKSGDFTRLDRILSNSEMTIGAEFDCSSFEFSSSETDGIRMEILTEHLPLRKTVNDDETKLRLVPWVEKDETILLVRSKSPTCLGTIGFRLVDSETLRVCCNSKSEWKLPGVSVLITYKRRENRGDDRD